MLAAIHADPLGLLVAFGAGMLSFLSPCVLPLVPGYVSMVSGLSAAELAGTDTARDDAAGGHAAAPVSIEVPVGAAVGPGHLPTGTRHGSDSEPAGGGSASSAGRATSGVTAATRTKLLRSILAFIAGFTVIFVILGASASALGRLFLTHQRALETASGVVIVLFGALLVAMATDALPVGLMKERRFAVRPSMLGAWAPPVMGMAFAFAWTPCIGPVLGSVLALAAGTGGSAWGGIVLLAAYSLGLGVPFLVCGLAFGRAVDVLGRVRSRLRWVDLAGGVVLIGFGLLLLTGNVDVIAAHISTWLRDLHLGRLSTS